MGRELRRVPKDWEHPKKANGHYQPMYDQTYKQAADEWIQEFLLWEKGEHPGQLKYECSRYYWDWAGDPPNKDYYRSEFKEEDCTHFQMYECTSEGTPISPVFDNIEDLAHWLADTGASSFADYTATYEEWLAMCKRGKSMSCVFIDGVMKSGVEVGV